MNRPACPEEPSKIGARESPILAELYEPPRAGSRTATCWTIRLYAPWYGNWRTFRLNPCKSETYCPFSNCLDMPQPQCYNQGTTEELLSQPQRMRDMESGAKPGESVTVKPLFGDKSDTWARERRFRRNREMHARVLEKL